MEDNQQNTFVTLEESSFNLHTKVNRVKEQELLVAVCKTYGVSADIINQLIKIELSMIGKKRRRGLQGQIEAIIQASLISKEEREGNYAVKKSNI
ncbi:hypothetical protein [Priestia aryabhattai]|uniref:hypothetical protein n=1 Tax=Priestia aryabhattai TaxID=412384 RepID=UPI003D2930FA